MKETVNHIACIGTKQCKVFLILVVCILASCSLYADESDSSKPQFNVYLALSKSGNKPTVFIENTGKSAVRSSELGNWGNRISVKMPSGKVLVFHEEISPNEEFVFEPKNIVRPGTKLAFGSEALATIIALWIKKPGKYEVWVDITSWIAFNKNQFVTKSSNKLIVFVDKPKNKEDETK